MASYLEGLEEARRNVGRSAAPLPTIQRYAKAYNISLAKTVTTASARTKVLAKLEELIECEQGSRRAPKAQGSTGGRSIASGNSRGASSSLASPRVPTASPVGRVGVLAGCMRTPARRISMLSTSPQSYAAAVTSSPAVQGGTGVGGGGSCPIAASRSSAGRQLLLQPASQFQQQREIHLLQRQVAELEQQLLQAELQRGLQLEEHQQSIAELQATVAKLQQQQHSNQRQILSQQHQLEQQAARLVKAETAAQQQASISDEVSKLHAKQEQQRQQHQLEECQRSVVVKDSEPLPAGPPTMHLQNMLRTKLGVKATVVKAQQLGASERGGSRRTTHAYKVVLASSNERRAVLKAKAAGLKGSSISIDVLLTPEQLASKQRLLPVARQAKADGLRVQWQYGTLLVEGKPYIGPGSLPSPAEQRSSKPGAAGQQQRGHPRPQPPAQQQPGADCEGDFQIPKQHQRKQQQQQRKQQGKPPAAAPAHAQQQQRAQPARPAKAAAPAKPPPGLGLHKPASNDPAPTAVVHSSPARSRQPPAQQASSGTRKPPASPKAAAPSSPPGAAAAAAGDGCSSPSPPRPSPQRA